MRQAWKDVIPTVLAILVFLVGELIDLLGIVPLEQWDKFGQIINGVMLAIAVLGLLEFFLKKRSSQANSGRNLARILGNMMIPLITFYMNVNMFQCIIRSEHLWEDIWGRHLFWLLYAIVEILLLSGLGKAILNSIRSFLGGTKNAVKQLRDAARDLIIHVDNYTLCAVSVSFICWVIYIGLQIFINGVGFIYSDTIVFTQSAWFWASSLLICLLVRIFPLTFQKAVEGVKGIKGKVMLGAIVVIALAILTCVLPSFPKAIAILILIPFVVICILCFIVRKLSQPKRKLGYGNAEAGTLGESQSNGGLAIKYRDLSVVILPFVMPLVIIFIITALLPEGKAILTTQDLSDINTWLEFLDRVAAVAQILLELFA